jgi:hypothetical protein
MNNLYMNSSIVYLTDFNGTVAAADDNEDLIQRATEGDSGTEWVILGDGSGGFYYINVHDSDNLGHGVAACTDGTDNQMFTDLFAGDVTCEFAFQ